MNIHRAQSKLMQMRELERGELSVEIIEPFPKGGFVQHDDSTMRGK